MASGSADRGRPESCRRRDTSPCHRESSTEDAAITNPTDHELAQLAEASYAGVEAVQRLWPVARVVEVRAKYDVAYVVLVGEGSAFVVFRGSDDKADWAANADLRRDRLLDMGKVHHGFNLAIGYMLGELWDLLDGRHTIHICGHSRGGAMAAIFAARWGQPEQNTTVASVVTFGSPRPGNRKFAKSYNALMGHKTRRYVNESDPVALLPSCLTGWRHVGGLLWWTGTKLRTRTKWLRWALVTLTARKRLLGDGFGDHSVANYVAITERLTP